MKKRSNKKNAKCWKHAENEAGEAWDPFAGIILYIFYIWRFLGFPLNAAGDPQGQHRVRHGVCLRERIEREYAFLRAALNYITFAMAYLDPSQRSSATYFSNCFIMWQFTIC